MSNTSTSNLLSVDSVKESSLSVISEQEILGKSFKIYGTFEEPLILAKDVAEWIEHSNITVMLQSIDDDEKFVSRTKDCLGRDNGATFLTENGVYEVLFLSRKPVAKEFKKEVKKILHDLRTNEKTLVKTSVLKDFMNDMKYGSEFSAKIEGAKILREIGNEYEGKSKTYKQILDAHATKLISGEFLLPLPATQKTYSAEDVAKELGISAAKVGRIANHYGLKTDEYGCWQKDKSKYADKEVDAFRYYENAISVIAEHKDEKISKEKKEKSSNQSDLFSN